MEELWISVKEYNFYEISSHGRIRSLVRYSERKNVNNLKNVKSYTHKTGGRIINGWVKKSKTGKPVCINVTLRDGTQGKEFRVHRLVLLNFIGDCPDGMEAWHNDGDPLNNKLDNLRWDSHFNNIHDMYIHNTKINPPINRGSNHANSKLTEENVKEIRGSKRYRGFIKELSLKFKVNPITITRVLKGDGWNHVK